MIDPDPDVLSSQANESQEAVENRRAGEIQRLVGGTGTEDQRDDRFVVERRRLPVVFDDEEVAMVTVILEECRVVQVQQVGDPLDALDQVLEQDELADDELSLTEVACKARSALPCSRGWPRGSPRSGPRSRLRRGPSPTPASH